MLSLFQKDSTKKLQKDYSITLQQAMQAQRRGDIRTYSELTAKADKLMQRLAKLEKDESQV